MEEDLSKYIGYEIQSEISNSYWLITDINMNAPESDRFIVRNTTTGEVSSGGWRHWVSTQLAAGKFKSPKNQRVIDIINNL